MMHFSRRRMLVGAAGTLASSFTILHRRRFGAASDAAAGSGEAALVGALARLAARGPEPSGVVDVGRRYAAGLPAPDPAALCREVLPDRAARRAFLAAGEDERRRIVLRRIAADFDAGRVVVVDGWVLSRTEAAFSAVAALA